MSTSPLTVSRSALIAAVTLLLCIASAVHEQQYSTEVGVAPEIKLGSTIIEPPSPATGNLTAKLPRSIVILVADTYGEQLDASYNNTLLHVVRVDEEGTLANVSYVMDDVEAFYRIYIGSTYNITYVNATRPWLGSCRVILDINRIPEPIGTLGTNPHHIPFTWPQPIGLPIEYTYGTIVGLNDAAEGWQRAQGETLLQPTWLPAGLNETAIYVQRAAYSTNNSYPSLKKGEVTQVTTLYSYSGIDSPLSAELQLRVQMAWVTPWMTPGNLRDYAKLGGNYTMVNGYPAWVGEIGWFEGDYFERYGGSAMVLSMEVGNVLYFFRVPVGFSMVDLTRIASSLSP